MSDVWLGLDVGTTAVKAAAYTHDGTAIASEEVPSKILRGPDGSNEQNMEDVWANVVHCLASVNYKCIDCTFLSLGVAAQGDGCWALDTDGTPVRNAILWSDMRKEAVADLSVLDASGALRAVGQGCNTALWPGTSAIGWRWMRKYDPDAAAKTAHVVTCGDFIGQRLTGEIGIDFSNATIPFFDFDIRTYGDSLSHLQCEELRSRLPEPRRATEILGSLTKQAAQDTGLPMGLPVSVPTLDLGAMIVGMGLSKPGEMMMIMGTTAVVNILTDVITPTDKPLAATVMHSTKDMPVRVLAPATGATAFDWFANLHPQSLGGDRTSVMADKLNTLVVDVPVGANGITFLPYLNGERAPFVAPNIRAGFLGMSASTTKADLGRAVMEGTALSLRHCCMSEGKLPAVPVHLTGGGARNAVWCHIIADVIGQDVLVNSTSDLGLWGAACIGAAAATGQDPIDLSKRDHCINRFGSNPEHHTAYNAVFDRFQALSDALRALELRRD
ncbi:MAG: FGGY family carbohydrate kinase [Aestuariivita sp.]|nr:FGGY family carbohydrate kinase [Aestuariivita sp.]MCY4345269.1 FGGY family carbohydrate kinase [Aestuariivita sp.]